jgi:hypothetical protein
MQPLVSREELTGIFFLIGDIAVDVRAIHELLREDDGGDDGEEDEP